MGTDAHASKGENCGSQNVLSSATVQLQGFVGSPQSVVDGIFAPEGASWTSHGVQASGDNEILVELEEAARVQVLVLQADHNDRYALEYTDPEGRWRELAVADKLPGKGLVTRRIDLPGPVTTSKVRLRGLAGDGLYGVAELHLACAAPEQLQREQAGGPPIAWGPLLTLKRTDGIKALLALLGAGVILWTVALRRAGRPGVDRKLRGAVLGVVAIMAGLSWWNFMNFHFPSHEHTWEHYHYYIGSKYFEELGYHRMYACAIVADDEAGVALTDRTFRNLFTNEMEPARAALRMREECARVFSADRWERYKRDLSYFRMKMGSRWEAAQHDHGYNATPLWTAVGGALANLTSASDSSLRWLSLLDPLLLLIMWGFVFWAFDWRVACVALIWWGTNYPGRYFWVGGGYLRQDWLATAVIGVCLMRRERPATAGFLLCWSTLLRVFPGFLVLGLVLKVLYEVVRSRSLNPVRQRRRFVTACAVTLTLAVGASALLTGGLKSWNGFVDNSRKHMTTPLTNNMGLKTAVGFSMEDRARRSVGGDGADPYARWKALRVENVEQRAWFYYLVVILAMAATGYAARHQPDWVALCAGALLVPLATELTCYYYSIMLIAGLLCQRGLWSCGAVLLLLSAITGALPMLGLWYDELYTLMSVMVVASSALMLWWMSLSRPKMEPLSPV